MYCVWLFRFGRHSFLFFSFFFLQAFFSFHFLRPAFYTVLALSMLDAEIQELRYQVGKFFQIVHATVGKPGLKLNIQKMKIMASGPITSWQIDGETMATVTDFIFFGSKITADSDCSHEIKRHLLLGRKAMTNLDSILKNRNITLPTEVCLIKAMVFPVVMYGCENWTIK